MKYPQAAAFIAHAHALTTARKSVQTPSGGKYRNHPATTLLAPYTRLIRAGVELRLNSMQIASSLKAIGDNPRIGKLSTNTLAGYVSVIRSVNSMPRTRGFLSQW